MHHLKSIHGFLLLLACCAWVTSGEAQVTLGGGKGQLRTQDADPIPAGQLALNGFYSLYIEKRTTSIPTVTGVYRRQELATDHTLNLSLTLGLSRYFELLLHAVPYQDTQHDLFGPIGDTRIGLKLHIPNRGSILQTGLLGFVSMPTAPRHNLMYESYSTDAYGWGLIGLLSLDLRSSATAIPVKFFANLGYRDHDWGDRFFSADFDQLLAGAGFKFPIRSTLLYCETTGEIFLNQMQELDLRQNLIRFSSGLRFLGPQQLVFDIAADVRLGNYRPDAAAMAANPFLKRYADWKILAGVTHRMQLFEPAPADKRSQQIRQAAEQEKNEAVRKQREQINREMEELRKKVEERPVQPPE